jgi:hypothetical protein
MSTPLSHRRYALAVARLMISVGLLGAASKAWADNITYYINDYPANEPNYYPNYGGTDTISGTITTDGTLGALSSLDILGGCLTFESPNGTWTAPLSSSTITLPANQTFQATTTNLVLYTSPQADLNEDPLILSATTEQGDNLSIYYSNAWKIATPRGPHEGNGTEYAYDGTYSGTVSDPSGNYLAGFPGLLALQSGAIYSTEPWIIATAAPEPAGLTLLGSAALGLGVVYLRRNSKA